MARSFVNLLFIPQERGRHIAESYSKGLSPELLDELLAGRDPTDALDAGGLIANPKKPLAGQPTEN